jgi:hypothetical protein
MKPKTKLGIKLQRFNRIAGSIHLLQAVALLFLVNWELKIPILTRFFDKAANGAVEPVTATLVNIPVALAAPIFLFISAMFHFIIASPFYTRRYEQNIKSGINPLRWWEYSLSSSIMLVVLLMLGGLLELPSIVFIFTLNFIMNLMGLVMERYNQLTSKTNWLPFNIGVLAGIVPWIIGGLYFWVSTSNIADSIPGYAKIGFLTTFLLFNTFAINMFLQYKKVGKWKNYEYGERAYIVLSLVAKTLLAWILVLGTMGQSS